MIITTTNNANLQRLMAGGQSTKQLNRKKMFTIDETPASGTLSKLKRYE